MQNGGKPVELENPKENPAYYKIADHYKFALDNLFLKFGHKRVKLVFQSHPTYPEICSISDVFVR